MEAELDFYLSLTADLVSGLPLVPIPPNFPFPKRKVEPLILPIFSVKLSLVSPEVLPIKHTCSFPLLVKLFLVPRPA